MLNRQNHHDAGSMPTPSIPLFVPLGDSALLIRFGDSLSEAANRAAIAAATLIDAAALPGILEVCPSLVSVLVRYDAHRTDLSPLTGDLRLLLSAPATLDQSAGLQQKIALAFDGDDLDEVSSRLSLTPGQFIAAHNARPLRVLSTGFSPGFLYCGFHPDSLRLPRRATVRRRVEPGTVLFAAGQTAITSTAIPTGWHVIGHTAFRNFDPGANPPVTVAAGDEVSFEVAP
jgi:KipI family sensor histidine kinase inhibitor